MNKLQKDFNQVLTNESQLNFNFDDGGRNDAGFKGRTSDCVVRSISIATGKPYKEVYDALNVLAKKERISKRKKKKSNSRTGVFRRTYQKYLESIGWEWISCFGIGTGCQVHLKKDELPNETIIARVSKHLTCVRNGKTIHDTHDPSRNGTRCVYGYFRKKK